MEVKDGKQAVFAKTRKEWRDWLLWDVEKKA